MGIKIPESAADKINNIETAEEKVIINPYHGNEVLTRMEAIDCINHLSGALLADECFNSKQ